MTVKRVSMLLVGVCLVSVRGNAVISRPPGDLIALNGATLSLVWSVAVADGDIKWCYWRYNAGSDPTHPWVRLQGWDNMNNVTIPYDNGGPGGWEDVSGKPCSTGIQKHRVTSAYEGVYEFGVIHNNGTEYVSNTLGVIVKADTQLSYDVMLDVHHYYPSINSPSKNISRAINITADEDVMLSATLNWDGASGDIAFHKVVSGEEEPIAQCQASASCSTTVKLKDGESGVSFKVGLSPSLQGSRPMTWTQAVQVVPAGSSINVAAIVIGTLLAIVIIAIITLWFCNTKRKGLLFKKRRSQPHELLVQDPEVATVTNDSTQSHLLQPNRRGAKTHNHEDTDVDPPDKPRLLSQEYKDEFEKEVATRRGELQQLREKLARIPDQDLCMPPRDDALLDGVRKNYQRLQTHIKVNEEKINQKTDKVTPGEDKQKKKMADLKVEAAAYDGKLLYLSEQLNACHDKLDAKLDDVEDGAKLDGGDVDMGVKLFDLHGLHDQCMKVQQNINVKENASMIIELRKYRIKYFEDELRELDRKVARCHEATDKLQLGWIHDHHEETEEPVKTAVKDEPPQEPKDTSSNKANTKTKSKTSDEEDGKTTETHMCRIC